MWVLDQDLTEQKKKERKTRVTVAKSSAGSPCGPRTRKKNNGKCGRGAEAQKPCCRVAGDVRFTQTSERIFLVFVCFSHVE